MTWCLAKRSSAIRWRTGNLHSRPGAAQRDPQDRCRSRRVRTVMIHKNGDGFITVEEFRTVLSSLGLKQGRSMEDCTRMIMKVDVDGDGMVNYIEFRQMMKGGAFGA